MVVLCYQHIPMWLLSFLVGSDVECVEKLEVSAHPGLPTEMQGIRRQYAC